MQLERFIFDFLSATQSAVIAAFKNAGIGNAKIADKSAVDAMRSTINKIDAKIKVAIGEGQRDKAPMLYIGEELGRGLQNLEIAVDPLEGTDLCANLKDGALCVLAFAKKGVLLNAPDVYMQKIFTNCSCAIDLKNTVQENLEIIAHAKKKQPSQLVVTVLKRKRHELFINQIRDCGAKVKLIDDGDIAAIISILINKSEDAYMGIGGAPEGVLAAVGVKNLGGTMICKLCLDSPEEISNAQKSGINNTQLLYTADDMVKRDAILIITGVTDGNLVNGVKKTSGTITTDSLIISDKCFYKLSSKVYT